MALIRELNPADLTALRRLKTAVLPRGHQIVVQELISDFLPLEVAGTRCTVVGAFQDDQLVGVGAIRMYIDDAGTPAAYIPVLAVGIGPLRRTGIGYDLKLHLLGLAETSGAGYVQSDVHVNNTPMIELNGKFGAFMELAGDREHLVCVVRLPWPF